MYTIINAKPFVDGKILDTTNIVVDNGIITKIGAFTQGRQIDAKGKIVCAGFIDIHTHGGFGKDCMEATNESIETIAKYHLSCGITSFVPTLMTASIKDITSAIENIKGYKSKYSRIIGIHLEGPFLSKNSAGAHPPQYLLDPLDENTKFVFENMDIVKRVTIAPNLTNAANFTKKAYEKGIQISLGHDESIDDEIYECIKNGANSITHLYNCTSRPSRRNNPKKHLGLTEIGLIDDSCYAEVIADNKHIPNPLFSLIFKQKGADKICLISDSLSIAGENEGIYYIGSGESKQEIVIEDNVAVIKKLNTYAGSITPISKMIVSLYKEGYKKEDLLKMVTLNQAKLLNLKDRGNIKVGMIADFNILNEDLSIDKTFLAEI